MSDSTKTINKKNKVKRNSKNKGDFKKKKDGEKVKEKKEKPETIEDDSLFKLKDILDLGGEKDDYVKLLELDENEEIETEDAGGSDIKQLQNEIQNFMQAIGFEDGYNDDLDGNVVPTKKETKKTEKVKPDKVKPDKVKPEKVKPKKVKPEKVQVEEEVEEEAVENTEKDTNTENERKKKKSKKSTTDELLTSLEYKKHERLILKNAVPWYERTEKIPKVPQSALNDNEVEKLQSTVKQYWDTEVDIYQQMKENDRSSDAKWLRTVLASGTLSDKVAALIMLSQESPIHSLKTLDALMNMSRKKARREALIAIDSLRHLYVAELLPDYKLRKFNEFPLDRLSEYSKTNTRDEQIQLLITMTFEETLKQIYGEFVEILQTFSKDPLADIRIKILGIVFELLHMKPEQEQALLCILVNKLGDPERKVASKSSYLLNELVMKHPKMKLVVIKEVERMMYRPNMSDKAQYYAICFLNQIVLSHQEKETASKLISLYFSFFKVIVARENKSKNKKASSQSVDAHKTKLLSGLLTGVNRAYPYVEGMDETYDDQLNTLFKLTHMKHFHTSIQAFMLIYQVMESRQSLSDRYYQALYAKLLDPDINTSKHTMFLNLLYKSMKNDPVLKRVKAFIKRLLQVCSQYKPSLLCGVLYLISEVIKNNPGINTLVVQSEENDEEEHFVDVPVEDDGQLDKFNSDDDECENKDESKATEVKGKGSWTFINHKQEKSVKYSPNHRNPLYANADKACLWETTPFLSYFHPSVVHFTNSVVNTESIEYQGDPSQDFTLISFLDRFMYRNPKKKDVDHGSSLMQKKESQRRKEEPVNSKNFLQKSEDKIPCDQLFFYRYFKQQMSEKETSKEEGKEDLLDEEFDVDDIDFAGEMKRDGEMKKSSKQRKEGDNDNDSESEEEEGDGFKYDYDNMDDEESSDEEVEEKAVKKKNFSDKDYEDALFGALDSDGESINGGSEDENEEVEVENEKDNEIDPMFADADDFQHMMNDEEENESGVYHQKQIQWEEKQDQKHWGNKKGRNNKGGNFKRKGSFKKDNNKNMKRKKTKK